MLDLEVIAFLLRFKEIDARVCEDGKVRAVGGDVGGGHKAVNLDLVDQGEDLLPFGMGKVQFIERGLSCTGFFRQKIDRSISIKAGFRIRGVGTRISEGEADSDGDLLKPAWIDLRDLVDDEVGSAVPVISDIAEVEESVIIDGDVFPVDVVPSGNVDRSDLFPIPGHGENPRSVPRIVVGPKDSFEATAFDQAGRFVDGAILETSIGAGAQQEEPGGAPRWQEEEEDKKSYCLEKGHADRLLCKNTPQTTQEPFWFLGLKENLQLPFVEENPTATGAPVDLDSEVLDLLEIGSAFGALHPIG